MKQGKPLKKSLMKRSSGPGLSRGNFVKKEPGTPRRLSVGSIRSNKKLGYKPKPVEVIAQEKADLERQWEMFRKIWAQRGNYSEVSGKRLGTECLSIYMHHILPKSKYPDLKYVEENIIILTWEEHSNVENDIYRYEEVNKRREMLKEKYDIP